MIFVKKISLKRDDDAAKKEEGRQWMEDRKNKRRRKKGTVDVEAAAPVVEKGRREGESPDQGETEDLGEKIERKIKKEGRALEEAAEVIDEAAGAMPVNDDGVVDRRA